MDSIPRLPMLFFETKTVEQHHVDFVAVLRRFIRDNYNEDPDAYTNEIKELESLRRSAVAVTSLSAARDVNSCSILKRYYAQLHSIRNRFLMARDYNALADLTFKWVDTYTDNIIVGDINYEMLSVLLNIGLVHVELGSVDSRSSDVSCKMACTHFQCAAYAFEQVNELLPGAIMSKDMAKDLLLFYTHISMAQAQECILEKSISDTRKPGIVAKVAAQVSEYYTSALMILLQGSLNSDRSNSVQEIVESRDFKNWKKYAEFKISYFSCMCNFFVGISSIESEKLGQAIAWFAAAEERLAEAAKHLKGMDRPDWSALMMDGIKSVTEIIKKKSESAKKENDFIFHEPIPTADKLTAVKGASLVKGIPFSVSDPEVLGTDIFRRLVPIEVYETTSIYSDKKDNMLRDVAKRIEEKNMELESYLSSLNLSVKSLRPAPSQVPDELIEICAALSLRKNLLENIEQKIMKLDELNAKVGSEIKKINSMILKEKDEEKTHQSIYGKRAVSTLIENLDKELEKHAEKHSKTSSSDSFLKSKFAKALPDLQMIIGSVKQLNKILPEPGAIPIDEENLKRLEEVLNKIDEMKKQRLMFEKEIREAVEKDDVLTKVMMSSGKEEVESLFEKELKKFDEKQTLLNMNLSAQDNIIEALTKANADYAPTRRAVMECESKRRTRTEEIIASYEAVQNINTSAEKGITFYEQVLQTLSSLESRVKSVCEIQATERAKNASKSNIHPVTPNPLSNMSSMSASLTMPDHRMIPSPAASSTPRLKDFLPYMVNKTQVQNVPHQPPVSQYMSHVPVTPPPHQPATSQPHYPPMQNNNNNSNSYAPAYGQVPVSQPHVPHVPANMYHQPQQAYAVPLDAYAHPQQAYPQPQPQHQAYPHQQVYSQAQQVYPQAPQHAYPHPAPPSPQAQTAGYWTQANGYQVPVTRPSADLLTDTVLETSDPNPILVPTPVTKES